MVILDVAEWKIIAELITFFSDNWTISPEIGIMKDQENIIIGTYE